MQPTKLLTAIETHQRLFIYRHTAPDPDAIGSQYGLALILKKAWPDKMVIPVGTVPAPLNWLGDPGTWPQAVRPTASDLAIVVDCANQDRIAGELPAKLNVTPAAATALYAGLIGDTVRFSTPGRRER